MDKKKLVKLISQETPTYMDAYRIVTRIFIEIKNAIKRGEKVVIHEFGSFIPLLAKARRARNPKTGEVVVVPVRNRVKFRQSRLFFS